MDLLIENSKEISGKVTPSPSKFQTQYATAIGLLADGESSINSPLIVDDTRDFAKEIEKMGGTTKRSKESWKIWGTGQPIKPEGQVADAKKSVLGLSLLSSISGLASRIMVVACNKQLRDCPVPSLLNFLQKIGVEIHSSNRDEKPPLIVFGNEIHGGEISLDKEADSRYLPALLLLTPFAEEEVEIVSFPETNTRYIEMSIDILKKSGIDISRKKQKIKISKGEYQPVKITPSLDIFSIFPYLTAAINTNSELSIDKTGKTSNLSEFINLVDTLGLELEQSEKEISIPSSQQIKSSEISLEKYPELLPFIAVLACNAEKKTTITNAEKARRMKSDRIKGTVEGLTRLGAEVEENEDGITIKKSFDLKGTKLNGYYDPELVAAFGTAGLIAEGKTLVKNRAEALRQTYPEFVTVFKNLGAKMSYST